MSVLDEAVSQEKDGTWTFQCPGVVEDGCGATDGPPFSSTGWPTKKSALARGRQHFDEHVGNQDGETPAPMPTLEEFRADQGLVVNRDGSVSVKDL